MLVHPINSIRVVIAHLSVLQDNVVFIQRGTSRSQFLGQRTYPTYFVQVDRW